MTNELIGQLIVCVVVALIVGALGVVQYKSNIAFNVGFVKYDMDSKIMARILGVHFMISAVVILLMPFVFYQFKMLEYAETIERLITCLFIIGLLVSINFQCKKVAKEKNNE